MEGSILATLAKWAFFMAALSLTMRWLGRSRLRPRPPEQAMMLAYPPSMLALALVGILFFCGVTVAAMIWPDPQHPVLAVCMLAGFILLPGALLADYVHARHSVSDQGMAYGRMSGRRGAFRWDEVKRVHYGKASGCFKLALQSGETVRISVYLMGLPAFADCVLRHVPAARIDRDAQALLAQTALGKPPGLA
ncbi:hypothetical protein [Massilia sp. MS-15]|uniref:hypothetical protein n=1 Tax=Massilia sp. MS-15 TaxID=2878200 RepID=UPI001CD5B2B3|nr:hypothetical protein [Massilia sp. MS-15]MCA1247993.1 hypothetical protein [Massilia sp. MS-15]